jgi:hypothetical protein
MNLCAPTLQAAVQASPSSFLFNALPNHFVRPGVHALLCLREEATAPRSYANLSHIATLWHLEYI